MRVRKRELWVRKRCQWVLFLDDGGDGEVRDEVEGRA